MTEEKQGPMPVSLEFNCPICGEKGKGLGRSLAKKVKERGLMRQEGDFAVLQFEGVVRDPAMEAKIPIGAKMPAFKIFIEACMECGCLYVGKMVIGEVVKGAGPPTIPPPPPGGLFSKQ
jgi:hypothetical protein